MRTLRSAQWNAGLLLRTFANCLGRLQMAGVSTWTVTHVYSTSSISSEDLPSSAKSREQNRKASDPFLAKCCWNWRRLMTWEGKCLHLSFDDALRPREIVKACLLAWLNLFSKQCWKCTFMDAQSCTFSGDFPERVHFWKCPRHIQGKYQRLSSVFAEKNSSLRLGRISSIEAKLSLKIVRRVTMSMHGE